MTTDISPAVVPLPAPAAWSGITPLPALAPVTLTGPDAVTFLQGQITQDVSHLTDQAWRLGGHCSAKGRMQASFCVCRPEPEQLLLLLDASLLPAWLKRLQMFVLRAKVVLADKRPDWQVLGVVGTDVAKTCWGPTAAALPVHGLAKVNEQQAALLRLPDAHGHPRYIWAGPTAAAPDLAALPALPADVWPWLDVMSGVPHITQATADQFVPQMVNFELLHGVDFRKGCYPGQEVVARSQYRGTIKRRLFLVHAHTPMQPMQDIYASADPGQPAGVVVNAAAVPGTGATTGWSALAELKLAHVSAGTVRGDVTTNPDANDNSLHLGQADGPALYLGSLPYALPDLGNEPDTHTTSATMGA